MARPAGDQGVVCTPESRRRRHEPSFLGEDDLAPDLWTPSRRPHRLPRAIEASHGKEVLARYLPRPASRDFPARSSSMRTSNTAALALSTRRSARPRSRSISRPSHSRRDPSPGSTLRRRSSPVSRRTARSDSSASDSETDLTSLQEGSCSRLYPKERHLQLVHVKRRNLDGQQLQETIYEEESDRESRHTRSYGRSRSRTPAHPQRRSHHGETSLEDRGLRSPISTRHPRKYYESETTFRRFSTTGGSHVTSSHIVSSSTKRASFLDTFFGPTLQACVQSKPVKLVECVVCLDEEKSAYKTARLACGHRMCHSCLKRLFKLSVTDARHMPPKCCTTDHIPLRHVERLFDTPFKKQWNRKFAEFSTRNRLYCPSKRCGEWIKPENLHREDGRKCGRCARCKTKVCGQCNGKWHSSPYCPRDETTDRFLEHAKEAGWQRCHRCKAMVELKEGCNHMTCRCGAEFCMICGFKWKTCECPWFNYEAVENDRLRHMNVPIDARVDAHLEERYQSGPASPRMSRSGPTQSLGEIQRRPRNFEEEIYLRRLQVQRDEHSARTLQILGDHESEGDGGYRDDFRQEATAPPQHGAAVTVSGPNYVSSVHRARRPRRSSLEQRLADRFNPDRSHISVPLPASPRPMAPPMGPPTSMAIMPRHQLYMLPPVPSGPRMVLPLEAPYITPVPMRVPLHVSPALEPPPPVPEVPRLPRRHTVGDDIGHGNAMRDDYSSSSKHTSRRSRGRDLEEQRPRQVQDRKRYPRPQRRPSDGVLAGLSGFGNGMDRVYEWSSHVTPGPPEGEVTPPTS